MLKEGERGEEREEGRCKISVGVDVSACTLEDLCSRRIRCTARGLALLMGGESGRSDGEIFILEIS